MTDKDRELNKKLDDYLDHFGEAYPLNITDGKTIEEILDEITSAIDADKKVEVNLNPELIC